MVLYRGHFVSVYELLQRLWDQGVKLLTPGGAEESARVHWVDPTYERVLAMVEDPKYAGVYAYPLRRFVTETDADGTTRKRVCKVPLGQWDVELRDHHPAYIRWARYERNQEKIAMNANRFAPRARGAALSGQALLVDLIRCRSCDHQMMVSYRSSGAIVYACQRGRRQRAMARKGCFSFRANELEEPLVEHACYQADLTRRRFDKVDPANRLVFDTLVEHVYAELDAARDEVVLYVHGSGGHVTELRHRRRRRKPGSTPSQLREVIESLRCVADDEAIARILNRVRLHTERGQSWTKRRVSAFRRWHGIAAFSVQKKEAQGWLSQAEAATKRSKTAIPVATLRCPVSDRFSVLIAERGWTRQNGPAITLFPTTYSQKGAS